MNINLNTPIIYNVHFRPLSGNPWVQPGEKNLGLWLRMLIQIGFVSILKTACKSQAVDDGAEDGIRTRDPRLGKAVLYH